MLYILYGLCGLLLGFIIGHDYGWDRHGLAAHGKEISLKAFIKKRILGD